MKTEEKVRRFSLDIAGRFSSGAVSGFKPGTARQAFGLVKSLVMSEVLLALPEGVLALLTKHDIFVRSVFSTALLNGFFELIEKRFIVKSLKDESGKRVRYHGAPLSVMLPRKGMEKYAGEIPLGAIHFWLLLSAYPFVGPTLEVKKYGPRMKLMQQADFPLEILPIDTAWLGLFTTTGHALSDSLLKETRKDTVTRSRLSTGLSVVTSGSAGSVGHCSRFRGMWLVGPTEPGDMVGGRPIVFARARR